MNEVVFPKRIDFGVCPLSETATRRVSFECKVPIQFEYELEVVSYHPDFHIAPTSGIVPANGKATVTIDFTPVKLTVASMTVLVKISQFGFKPFRCEITGSAAAGMTREAAMKALFQEVRGASGCCACVTGAHARFPSCCLIPTGGCNQSQGHRVAHW